MTATRHLEPEELVHQAGQALGAAVGKPELDVDAPSLDPSQVAQLLPEPFQGTGVHRARAHAADREIAEPVHLPTSMGVNPCYTVYALGRYIAQAIVEDVRA